MVDYQSIVVSFVKDKNLFKIILLFNKITWPIHTQFLS